MRQIIIVWGIESLIDPPETVDHVQMFNVILPNDAAQLAHDWCKKGWIVRIITGEMNTL